MQIRYSYIDPVSKTHYSEVKYVDNPLISKECFFNALKAINSDRTNLNGLDSDLVFALTLNYNHLTSSCDVILKYRNVVIGQIVYQPDLAESDELAEVENEEIEFIEDEENV